MDMRDKLVERLEEYGFVCEAMTWKIKRGLVEVLANPWSIRTDRAIGLNLEVSSSGFLKILQKTFILRIEDLEDPACIRKMVCKVFEELSTKILIPLCEQVSEIAVTGDI